MNPTARKLYAVYGQQLANGQMGVRELARLTGHNFHQCRAAYLAALESPPPDTWRVVVAGDLHFCSYHPEESLRVAEWFGAFIDAQGKAAMRHGEKFTAVSIGDAADFASLSSFDKGKKSFEGRELRRDYETVNRCIARISAQISNEVWAYMARAPFVTTGNHEERVLRMENEAREFSGTYGIGYKEHDGRPVNLEWRQHGWDVYPFLRPAFIDDVGFLHYVPSPKTGRAIASVNQARALLMTTHQSVVVGHSHEWRTGRVVQLDGSKIVATSVGCSFIVDHDYAGYLGNANCDRGFTVLRGLCGSEYAAQFLPFTEVMRYLEEREP